MLEDTSRNGTLVDDEMIHHAQIALHPEKSNAISVGSLEFLIHVRTPIDSDLIPIANVVTETLDLDELELQTQTQTQTQTYNAPTSQAPHTPALLHHKYHILTISPSPNVKTVRRLIEKSSGRHALGKFYTTPIEQRMAGKSFIELFTVLKVRQST